MSDIVHLENLTVKNGENLILEDVTLEISSGETVAILGASGCGKSTLLDVIHGIVEPTSGTVSTLQVEQPVDSINERDRLRAKIGRIFQGGALFESMTVAQNLACILAEHTELTSVEIEILVKLRLEAVGLRTVRDLSPAELGGGQRARLALARALVLDPPLLLCDDPGAGLDPPGQVAVDRVLKDQARLLGATVIVATHRVESALRIADRWVLLHRGQVQVDGPPVDLLQHPNLSLREFLEASPVKDAKGTLIDFTKDLLGKEASAS